MDWRTKKELEEKRDALIVEYSYRTLFDENKFVRELHELCNLQAHYTAACERLDAYCEKEILDKKIVADYEDEVLSCEVEFYSAFVDFVEKFESSRVHSAMGSKTSERKKKTSAENGKKGGRPRKKNTP